MSVPGSTLAEERKRELPASCLLQAVPPRQGPGRRSKGACHLHLIFGGWDRTRPWDTGRGSILRPKNKGTLSFGVIKSCRVA